jgi:hypothetical protein
VEGKFFVINKILKERIAEDGETEYFVNFLNYETGCLQSKYASDFPLILFDECLLNLLSDG